MALVAGLIPAVSLLITCLVSLWKRRRFNDREMNVASPVYAYPEEARMGNISKQGVDFV